MSPPFLEPDRSIVLASASATRSDMLRRIGLTVIPDPARIDEREIEERLGGASPLDVATALADAKALDVAERHPDAVVIGADQTLDCEGRLFHKPANRAAADAHLAALSGRTHRLISAAAIVVGGEVKARVAGEARLTMRALDPNTIERYLDAAGPDVLSSVGCYRVEDLGAALFESIEGDWFTILGLPLLPLLSELRRLGLVA